MLRNYLRWNVGIRKWLWYLVIIGLFAALPLIYERVMTEKSAKTVEIIFDYRDLIEVSTYKPDPRAFLQKQLREFKAVGITSMAVYESTLEEWKNSRRVQLLNAQEYALLTGNSKLTAGNSTYVLFADRQTMDRLGPLLQQTFSGLLKLNVHTWSYNNQPGFVIDMPYEDAILKPMPPDPIAMDMLRQEKFNIVVRLSNRFQPFSVPHMDAMLQDLRERGVKTVIFDGTIVTGFDDVPKKSYVASMAQLMKKHGIAAAAVEMLKQPQKGFNQLAYALNYNVVRLHSLAEKDAAISPEQMSDRLTLAVKDRNIRMLFLNTKATKDLEKGYFNDHLDNIVKGLTGPEGAVQRIKDEGYVLGVAQPFTQHHTIAAKFLKPLLLLGAVALIALTCGYFVPQSILLLFILGCLGTAVLALKSSTLALQAIALGVGIFAPTLAIIFAVRRLNSGRYRTDSQEPGIAAAWSIFIATALTTMIGVVYVVGLLSGIRYYLLLEQFRGVSLLHLLPIVLSAAYLFLIHGTSSLKEAVQRLCTLLGTKISVFWLIVVSVAALALWYYLSRTGNEGQVSAYEKIMRSILEQNLGIRPRTKEFLFAHPLFLIGIYYAFRIRGALILFAVGAVGQLSIVDTFAHLHTPLDISVIRAAYGLLFGGIIGLFAIAVVKVCVRGWRKWAPMLKD